MAFSPSSLGRVPAALLVSALAGLLLAGLALPPVAAVALAAKAGAEEFDQLPADLGDPPLAQRSRLQAVDGTVLAELWLDYDRVSVSLEQVPQQTRNAFLAIEDSRFYEHDGVDLQGLARAAVTNQQAGEVRQGGSTLTQQYVKLLLQQTADTEEAQQAATAQTVGRKIREARLALELETRISKDEILQGYLNAAYYGDGVYGIGTASTHYFSKPVSELTLGESALLAGVLQSPETFNPRSDPVDATERRNVVLRRMAELGFVSAASAQEALAQDIADYLDIQESPNGCRDSSAPFFCDLVVQQALDSPALGADRPERLKNLFQGGLTITTSLRPEAQEAAEAALEQYVPTGDRFGASIAMVVPGTGGVAAVANNRVYGEGEGETTVNFATGRGGAGFQAGSTFKTFTLAAALQEGVPLDLSFYAPNEYHSVTGDNPPADGDEVFGNAVDEGENGTYDLARATRLSVNTFFVPLEERVGVLDIANLAQRMGVRYVNATVGEDPITPAGLSFTLGSVETTPLSLANAYATLAAGGVACDARAILGVVDSDGNQLEVPPPSCEQVLEPAVAHGVTSLLQGVIGSNGTAPRAAVVGRPAAGKTGTTQEYNAAFFAGYVPQLASAVWVGHPEAPAANPLRNVRVGGRYYRRVFGGTLPAPIWGTAMRDALQGVPVQSFPSVDQSLYSGEQTTVPRVVGLTAAAAGQALIDAGLGYQVGNGEGKTRDSSRVFSQSRRPGSSVERGTTVILSTGADPYRRSSSSSRSSRSSRSSSNDD